MMSRSSLTLIAFLTACASAAAQKGPPQQPAPPPPAPAPARPADPPPQPPVAKAVAPPITAQPCNQRRVSFNLVRAVGMGSYITTLTCSENRFTVVSDRAAPDGKEVQTAFQIPAEEWERAFQSIERLNWRTFDDACSPREAAQGRGDGPVYRITIEEPSNRRSFTCAGARDLADKLDAIEATVLALAPAEPIPLGPAGVGVKECDAYLDRYEKCVNTKVPAARRKGFLDAIQFTRQAMHETLMRNPDSEEALAKQCTDMHAAARTAMATFKCKM